jgi:hypothetical protein
MKNGRNFEYMSGEDPILGATLVGPLVNGIQENVMSIAKHYIGNTQETHRQGVNEVIDEVPHRCSRRSLTRWVMEVTLMELYGPPFAAAARAGVAGYMCAYNRVNGVYACENEATLRTMLKASSIHCFDVGTIQCSTSPPLPGTLQGYYNHTGFVVSDWGATHRPRHPPPTGLRRVVWLIRNRGSSHGLGTELAPPLSTGFAIENGLDIEMPQAKFFTPENIQAALHTKVLPPPTPDPHPCRRRISRPPTSTRAASGCALPLSSPPQLPPCGPGF